MKIQYLAIIFLIIILPMTLVLTFYNQSQINNLDLQLKYNGYLSEATHDAVKAFELNTVHNTYADVADSLKRDVEAAVNVFLNSMASSLGTSGATAEAVSEYVPALLFTMYDGYYIYAPAYSEELEETTIKKEALDGTMKDVTIAQSQNPKVENFTHMVKPYVYYTMRYNPNSQTDFIVNYTLDNYITVYGKVNGDYVTKSGYLLEMNTNNTLIDVTVEINQDKLLTVLKRDVLTYALPLRELDNASASDIKNLFNAQEKTSLKNEILNAANGSYKTSLISNMGEILLNHVLDRKNNNILLKDIPISKIEEVFGNKEKYIDDIDEVIDCFTVKYKGQEITDRDAKLYYVKALQFTQWVNNNLANIQIKDARDSKGNILIKFEDKSEKVFNTKSSNNPEELTSVFSQHKIEVIKESIQSNLTSAIARYNQQFFGLKHGYDLKMPVLTEVEWETITNKVTMVSFMQGMVIGTKVFNDYCVVASDSNDEVVDVNQIYYFDRKSSGITYYHKFDCPNLLNEIERKSTADMVGYKGIQYDLYKTQDDNKEIKYQLGVDVRRELFVVDKDEFGREIITTTLKPNGITDLLADYDCLVNRNYTSTNTNNIKLLYAKTVAIARERNKHYKVNSYMDTILE